MPITKRIVYLCYFLAESPGYAKSKSFCYDLLVNPQSRLRPYFDFGMMLLILTTVFLLIIEVKRPLTAVALWLEQIAVGIFVLEYLLRLWIYSDSHKIIIDEYEKAAFLNAPFRLDAALWAVLRKKWEYMTTPLAIIDLLAILPSYRPLRILRFFLLFRVFKLFRYTRSVNEFGKVLLEKRFEFYTLLMLTGFLIFASATVIYLFEAHDPRSQINTFFDAVYWSLVTLSTVGYGDITPQSTEGRIVTMVLIFSGIGVISFATSIVVSAFGEKLLELREQRVFSEIERTKDLIIVCGFGRVGQVVVEKLAAEKVRFVIIDTDEAKVERAKERGYLAICGDAAQTELLESIGIHDRVETVLCITNSDVINVFITLSARHLKPDVKIISRANAAESEKKLYLAGADHVIAPYEAVGLMAAEYIGQPVASRAINSILSGDEDMTLDAIVVGAGSFLDQRGIGEIDFLARRLLLFGVITPDAEDGRSQQGHFDLRGRRLYFNPAADFIVLSNDILVVFGREVSIAHFRDRLEESAIRGTSA